jgi:hypothetical protein
VIPLGHAHLCKIVSEYVEHHHRERNHQGLGNQLIARSARMTSAGGVKCRQRLGGTLEYYHREAA